MPKIIPKIIKFLTELIIIIIKSRNVIKVIIVMLIFFKLLYAKIIILILVKLILFNIGKLFTLFNINKVKFHGMKVFLLIIGFL